MLQEDIEEFRLFLNQSYEANDFHVKTLVNITMTILDELAIRDHIDSVPKIISEMWQVLGNSGKALNKSFEWLVQSIKTSYKKAVELLSGIFSGEAMVHLSALMESAVQKYDKFVKDLHLSFIKYVENIWTRITQSIVAYWKGILHKLEPSILRLVHYVETVAWNISKEVFGNVSDFWSRSRVEFFLLTFHLSLNRLPVPKDQRVNWNAILPQSVEFHPRHRSTVQRFGFE